MIIRLEKDTNLSKIFEALLITSKEPSLNGQATGTSRVLKLYSSQPETNHSAFQKRSQFTAPLRRSACQNQSPGCQHFSDAANTLSELLRNRNIRGTTSPCCLSLLLGRILVNPRSQSAPLLSGHVAFPLLLLLHTFNGETNLLRSVIIFPPYCYVSYVTILLQVSLIERISCYYMSITT